MIVQIELVGYGRLSYFGRNEVKHQVTTRANVVKNVRIDSCPSNFLAVQTLFRTLF